MVDLQHPLAASGTRCCGGRSRPVEVILKAAIDTAAESKAVKSAEFERIAVDTAEQEKAQRHSAIKRAAKPMPVSSSVWRAR